MDKQTMEDLASRFNLTTEQDLEDTKELIRDMIDILNAILEGKDIYLSEANEESWMELIIDSHVKSPMSYYATLRLHLALEELKLERDWRGIGLPKVADIEELKTKVEQEIKDHEQAALRWQARLIELKIKKDGE